jgi:uncharacterized protein (TIGR02452 family)
MDNIFQKRIDCWKHTLHLSNNLSKPPPSLKIRYDKQFKYYKKYEKSNIKFFDMDTIDCCLLHSPNALVLNLADDIVPGGCVDVGSGAQEESLFRRTNYCASLKIELYPIRKDEIIYSPEISIIKTSEHSSWELLDINNLNKISFIACPGIKYPETIRVDHQTRLNKKDTKILKRKIKLMVQTAINFNYDTIIFGALGCGAWRNPIEHVAEIFRELLQKLDGTLLNFYFAIMTNSNNHKDNGKKTIDIFKDVFNNQ